MRVCSRHPNNRGGQNFIPDRAGPEWRAMKSRFLLWWMSFSASVTLFLVQKLNAVGQIIALELEGSYRGATGCTTSGRKPEAD